VCLFTVIIIVCYECHYVAGLLVCDDDDDARCLETAYSGAFIARSKVGFVEVQ